MADLTIEQKLEGLEFWAICPSQGDGFASRKRTMQVEGPYSSEHEASIRGHGGGWGWVVVGPVSSLTEVMEQRPDLFVTPNAYTSRMPEGHEYPMARDLGSQGPLIDTIARVCLGRDVGDRTFLSLTPQGQERGVKLEHRERSDGSQVGVIIEPDSAGELREHLHIYYGTDWDLSDEHLRAEAERALEKVRQSGRRWSWKVLAGEALRQDREPPSDKEASHV